MATRADINQVYNLVDGLAKAYEAEEMERLGMREQLRRQQKWIDQAPISRQPR
jgi:hypothetical protein